MPSTRLQWVVVLGVVALHFLSVARALGLEVEHQLLGVGIAVFAIERWWGPARLPLSVGRIKPSLCLTGKLVLVGALLLALGVLAQIACARLGGMRWSIQPGYAPAIELFPRWLILSVLWGPLIEEILYRGFLQARLVAITGRIPAIVISAVIFWMLHWAMRQQLTAPHHLLIGLLLAWTYDRTRSLLAPLLLHALVNATIIADTFVRLRYAEQIELVLGW